MPTISISEYWNGWLTRVTASGIRKSKASVVEESLSRHRRHVEAEMEEYLQIRAEIKDRREVRNP